MKAREAQILPDPNIARGGCTVESDTPQAVVLATLSALNRVVAGMKAKEPTEYVLRSESYASDPV